MSSAIRRSRQLLRRQRKFIYLVVVGLWLLGFVVGALNHTILPTVFSTRLDLSNIPHLQFGYVMFNRPLSAVYTFEYTNQMRGWRPLGDLEPTAALGYKNARAWLNSLLYPHYLWSLCKDANRERRYLALRLKYYDPVNVLRQTKTIVCSEQNYTSLLRLKDEMRARR